MEQVGSAVEPRSGTREVCPPVRLGCQGVGNARLNVMTMDRIHTCCKCQTVGIVFP